MCARTAITSQCIWCTHRTVYTVRRTYRSSKQKDWTKNRLSENIKEEKINSNTTKKKYEKKRRKKTYDEPRRPRSCRLMLFMLALHCHTKTLVAFVRLGLSTTQHIHSHLSFFLRFCVFFSCFSFQCLDDMNMSDMPMDGWCLRAHTHTTHTHTHTLQPFRMCDRL